MPSVQETEHWLEDLVPAANDELWIREFSLNESDRQEDSLRLVLDGRSLEFRVILREDAASVVMRDRGKPKSHGEPPQGDS